MPQIRVTHETHYRYAEPVILHDQRLMIRPRDSHDLRLISAELTTSPAPTGSHWYHDVFGNSVAVLSFDVTSDHLKIVSTLVVETYAPAVESPQIRDYARTYPFSYTPEEKVDLGVLNDRQYDDEDNLLADWVRDAFASMAAGSGAIDTLELLRGLNSRIHAEFAYQSRYSQGTQTPVETLRQRSGSCRDFALLLIEAARHLGFAARFVSGYLIDKTVKEGERAMVGGGATHAWAQIYIPGLGWVEFDPTNEMIGSNLLLRVAVTRDPAQAVPVAGSFTAPSDTLAELTVDVTTSLLPEPQQVAA